ncbi:hypothetical protein FSW04_18045 [Baekduia soli]|uniref:Uncharacterized protein n=1 Tax=Baekduia soli TaxID=496014 RepID=A0A5B8U9H7_9ACTN|nr:hypothetical protein [Baekduia soli]QEC49292.1 hypothetical protein FSW04_18045 [Baekduia soli]
MAAWEPLWMTAAAWQALRDGVVEPAARDAGAGAAGLRERLALRDTWADARRDGERVGVFLTPELAGVLAGLLDEHPELARLLAG